MFHSRSPHIANLATGVRKRRSAECTSKETGDEDSSDIWSERAGHIE
jgi:hypothetical protein